MPPKTRSQGAASPAHELQAPPSRTRTRKLKTIRPNSALSLVTSSSSSTEVETAPAVVASSPITQPSIVLFPVASSPAPKASQIWSTKVSHRQLLRSKGSGLAGLSHSCLLRSSKTFEESVRSKPSAPELNDLPCCMHCRLNPFDLDDVLLVAPYIVHPKLNYKNASTQSSANETKESGLTVLSAYTPVKRTRDESAGEFKEEPAAKRHQSNATLTFTRTSTSKQTSIPPSTNTSTQNSTPKDSSIMTVDQLASTSVPITPKRAKMVSIAQAKSRAQITRFSPVTRSNVDPLQITSNMTWGQMTRVHSRRAKLAASRANQTQSLQDEEVDNENLPQASQPATDQAQRTPQTAPQPKTGLFNSIRKTFEFVPQIPVSVTKYILGTPFSPTRSTPAVESQQQIEPPSPQEPAKIMEVEGLNPSPEQELKEARPPPPKIEHSHSLKNAASSVNNAKAVASNSQLSSQKRKRITFGLYYDNPEYSSEASDSDSLDKESSASAAKKQKLDETQTPRSVLKKSLGNWTGTFSRTNKHVTFDDSPLDTPSKIRSRSFEYTGTTFADAPGQSFTSPSSDDETNLSNSPGTKANTEANTPFSLEPPKYPPLPQDYVLPADFIPTSANPRPGTFCLDFNTYDENDDNIDWDAPVEAIHSNIVIEDPDTPTSVEKSSCDGPATIPARESPPATPRITHAELPAAKITPAGITIHSDANAGPSSSTTADANVLAEVTQEQINKARSTAEQHKSKNPSRLSQVELATSMSPPAEDKNNEFDVSWPKPKTYVEAGVCSQRIFDIVNKNWDPRDSVIGEMVYEQDLKEWTDAHRLEKEHGVPVRVDWGDEDEEL